MPCNSLAVDLIRLFNKLPVIRPSLSVIYRKASFMAEIILHRFKCAI